MAPSPASLSHWQHYGACRQCGYSLRNLPQPVCPECGQTFDPNDPKTMAVGGWGNWLDRLLLSAPGWLSHMISALPLLLAIGASTDVIWNSHALPWSYLLLLILIPYWFLRLITWLALGSYYGIEHTRRRTWWGWLVTPACCGGAIALWIWEM